jgi:hypothetical protein
MCTAARSSSEPPARRPGPLAELSPGRLNPGPAEGLAQVCENCQTPVLDYPTWRSTRSSKGYCGGRDLVPRACRVCGRLSGPRGAARSRADAGSRPRAATARRSLALASGPARTRPQRPLRGLSRAWDVFGLACRRGLVRQSLMPRSASHGWGSCLRPLASQISKCRCVPVDWPRLPIRAIWSPALT